VLLYDGTLDLLCNHIGYLRLAHSLEWSGQAEFASTKLRPWSPYTNSPTHSQGIAGETKSVRSPSTSGGSLTWATFFGAGHLVPYDKPVEALHMINSWLAEEDL